MFTEFLKNIGLCPNLVKSNNLPEIDQFQATEFFKDENGMILADFDVFARSQGNPELQAKIREYLVEQDVHGFDSSVSDEDVFNQLSSKYESTQSILDRVKARIIQLRAAPVEKKTADE